jgi:hypothetical protein
MSTPKDSLLSRIHEIVKLLNGYVQGKRGTFANGFRSARYEIVLFAGTTMNIFSEQTRDIRGSIYFNFYRLQKVANWLQLEFDRTKIAKKIYSELESKGLVVTETEDNKTYIALTDKGKEDCLKLLEELCELNRRFYSNPTSAGRYFAEDGYGQPAHEKSGSLKLNKNDMIIDRLIRSISDR